MSNFEFVVCFLLTFNLIYGTIGVYMSVKALIKIEAFERSTHKIEYLDPKWATSEAQIAEMEEDAQAEMQPLDNDDIDEEDIDLNRMI